jgi:hypothetical protein
MSYVLNIPDHVNELSLEAYQHVQAIKNPTDSKILKTLFGLSQKDLAKIPLKDVKKINSKIDKLFHEEADFVIRFKIDDVEYGFIPNLDDITYGENKDIATYLGKWENMHKAMAVMYRPIIARVKDKYEIEAYEGSAKYADIMKKAPLGVVLGSMIFFCRLTNELASYIQSYLESDESLLQSPEVLVESGDQLRNYILSLKETFDDLTKSLNYDFTYV